MLNENKDFVIYKPNGLHDPTDEELKDAYVEIFNFLDNLWIK